MIPKKTKALIFYHFNNLTRYEGKLIHFITTRTGGFSLPPYGSLNLAGHVGDAPERVCQNRNRLASSLGVSSEDFVYADQVHGSAVRTLSKRGLASARRGESIGKADSLVTDVPQKCLMILIGDCVPILLFDPRRSVIASVHAGWKGTVRNVVGRTVRVMVEKYGSSAKDILAGIGPSIGPCCYEVGLDVISAARSEFQTKMDRVIRSNSTGESFFDLWTANRIQMLGSGLCEKNIETAGLCTRCHHDLFFSRRFAGAETGRFAAGIMKKDKNA